MLYVSLQALELFYAVFFTLTFAHRKTPKDNLIIKENSTLELC